jgi:hypothetical protein
MGGFFSKGLILDAVARACAARLERHGGTRDVGRVGSQ